MFQISYYFCYFGRMDGVYFKIVCIYLNNTFVYVYNLTHVDSIVKFLHVNKVELSLGLNCSEILAVRERFIASSASIILIKLLICQICLEIKLWTICSNG